MTSTVKGAGVLCPIADGRPLLEAVDVGVVETAVLVQHVLVDGDVRRQHGVGICIAAVDQLGEPVELRRGADLVDAVFALLGRCRPPVILRPRADHQRRAHQQQHGQQPPEGPWPGSPVPAGGFRVFPLGGFCRRGQAQQSSFHLV